MTSTEEANAYLTERSLLHKNATHNCWAYMTGPDKNNWYFSDNGEPSGTAGKPILGSIESTDVTNVAVMVTRYFGGIKLGVRGLIDAYSSTAKNAILKAGIYKYTIGKKIKIISSYNIWNRILYDFKFVEPKSTEFTDKVQAYFVIPQEYSELVESRLRQYEAVDSMVSHVWGEEIIDKTDKIA